MATAEGYAPDVVTALDADGLDRGVGFLGLMWASETSIIGSGWLFTALTAAVLAGPAAIIGWVLGSIIIICLAVVHAELGALFPVTGGTSRFPHYAFGSFAGATFGWASYLQAATVAPIEVLAAIQYLSTAHWANNFYVKHHVGPGTLSNAGIAAAIFLMVVFVILNLVGIRWLARVSNAITWWKVAIPLLTVVVLLAGHFHSGNFGNGGGGFFVHQSAFKTILLTLPAGIIFSLLGFEQALQLGGEARNPADLPKAVIGSILIGAAIYILVQIAFIGAMDPHLLSRFGGWTGLGPTNHAPSVVDLNKGPFYTVASLAGIAWLATLLRIDAVVSPAGTGIIYQTSSARLSFGLSKNGLIPSEFEATNPRTKIPVFGVIIAAAIGLLFLLPFPSWSQLVSVVTLASVLMYAAAPLALAALRKQKPDLPRSFRLPFAEIIAPVSFIFATWVIVFCGWQTYTTLLVAMLLGYLLIWGSYAFHMNENAPAMDWNSAPWIAAYFVGIGIISYLGDFGAGGIIGGIAPFTHVLDKGGTDDIGLGGTLIASAIWALVIYFWAVHTRLPESKVDEYVRDVYPPSVEGH
jgi:amino acid transporter